MLHVISRAPFNEAILGRLGEGDAVILIEDAVITLLQNSDMAEKWKQMLKSHRICALQADLEVRGIDQETIVPGIEIVNDYGFVELTVEKSAVCSWC